MGQRLSNIRAKQKDLPRARCEVIARMWLGGDPLAVRIGGSTFALRRIEAAAVRVQRLQEQPIESTALDSGNASAANAAIA